MKRPNAIAGQALAGGQPGNKPTVLHRNELRLDADAGVGTQDADLAGVRHRAAPMVPQPGARTRSLRRARTMAPTPGLGVTSGLEGTSVSSMEDVHGASDDEGSSRPTRGRGREHGKGKGHLLRRAASSPGMRGG